MQRFRWDFEGSAKVGGSLEEEGPAALSSRLELLGTLGKGGMGEVLLARDVELDREVAVKLLSQPLDEKLQARFVREAELTAALHHPGIVGIHWVGVTTDGRSFLVLELVEGAQDLEAAFATRFPLERLELVQGLARAVAFVHSRGIVHRDIKPQNVLVDRDGHPRLCDLGLARYVLEQERLTRTGARLGTPLYMAPEQFRSGPKAVDPRLDVWALGVLLYQALTGEHPHFQEGMTLVELMARIERAPLRSPRSLNREVSPALAEVCQRALKVDPAARFPDAGAFAEALERARFPGRRRALPLLAVSATCAAALGAGLVLLRQDSSPAPVADRPPPAVTERADPLPSSSAPEPRTAREFFNRAETHRRAKDHVLACTDLDRALALDPEFVLALITRGAERALLGNLSGAESDFSRAIDLDPQSTMAYSGRGALRYQQGRSEEAMLDLTRAVELDPRSSIAFNNRGAARRAMGDLPGAAADMSRAIEIDPSVAMSYNGRGLVRRDMGDLSGAIADHTQAIALDPTNPLAFNNRGGAKLALGDVDGALQDFERAVAANPRDAMGYANRAVVYGKRGDLRRAIADLDHAVSLDPDSVLALQNRGFARSQQGDLEGALRDYESALRASKNPQERAGLQRRIDGLEARLGR